jgi:calcineurin-like phosphoesterase
MEAKKQILRDRLSWMRGTPAAMVAAAQTELTGAKRVVLRERFTGDPWKINVVTFTSETTDPSKVLDKLLSQKPAGIVLTHTVVDGQDYQILLDNHATYSDVLSTYATYGGVLLDVPGA